MPAYVDLAYVKAIGSMPAADIDLVESLYPTTFDTLALAISRLFDARLGKRYGAPWDAGDVPEVVKLHVAHVVVYFLWKKRGFNPGSAQDELVVADKDAAEAWLKEAADSKDGLIELPLKESTPKVEGVSRGGPLSYTETSPYVWTDRQVEDGRTDDRS